MTPRFLPGLELARDFYAAVVRPLLQEDFPWLEHAAALIGPGSDVAGYDTERSTDHDWGPRLQVFLAGTGTGNGTGTGPDTGNGTGTGTGTGTGNGNGNELSRRAARVTAMLAGRLPGEFRGYRVRFPVTREPDGVARHRVEVAGLGAWLTGWLGFDPRGAVTLQDWLATPTQRLAELTAGEVFHDGPGELTRARGNTAWYPDDVWRYVLACQWRRVDQEEPFPGRCAEVGDDLGARIVTARLARDLMRLCLLMHRQYPPYSKWLGTAFARLPGGAGLAACLTAAIAADGYQARERHLTEAMEAVAALHNRLGLTPPLDPRARRFFDRPYQVIGAGRFTAALRETITDPRVRHLPLAGAVDQFTDSADAAGDPGFLRACVDRGSAPRPPGS